MYTVFNLKPILIEKVFVISPEGDNDNVSAKMPKLDNKENLAFGISSCMDRLVGNGNIIYVQNGKGKYRGKETVYKSLQCHCIYLPDHNAWNIANSDSDCKETEEWTSPG